MKYTWVFRESETSSQRHIGSTLWKDVSNTNTNIIIDFLSEDNRKPQETKNVF